MQTPSTNITRKNNNNNKKTLRKKCILPLILPFVFSKMLREHLKLFYCIMLPFLFKDVDQGWLFFKWRLLFGLRMFAEPIDVYTPASYIYMFFLAICLKKKNHPPFLYDCCNTRWISPHFVFSSYYMYLYFFPHFSKYLTEIVVRYVSLYKSKQPKIWLKIKLPKR